MKFKITTLLVSILVTLVQTGYSQKANPTDYYANIKKADVSKLWHSDASQAEIDSLQASLPEPLGFIGDNCQRFYIHFISVKKNKENPYQYIVKGKTKVKENICNFTGTINLIKAGIYNEQFDENYKQGYVECDIILYEDSTKPATGFFKGKLISKFYLDKSNKISYDDLEIGADGFCNNQCEAVWTSYTTRKNKKCNWGDYRIPDSKALDSGDGEFAISKKYDLYGWKNYRIAWSGNPWIVGTGQSREAENKHWWK